MNLFLTIIWNINPEILGFIDNNKIPIRWYGVLFAISFYFGFKIIDLIFTKEKISKQWLDKLFMYAIIAIIVGARLGHVLFYGPYFTENKTGYFDDPLSILKIWEGGLASHGAAIGLIIALIIFSKKITKKSPLWILDRIVIVVALSGFFIRMGNLMNSEIVGKSNSMASFVFANDTKDFFYNQLGSVVIDDFDFKDIGESEEINSMFFEKIKLNIILNGMNRKSIDAYFTDFLPVQMNEAFEQRYIDFKIDKSNMNLKVAELSSGKFEVSFISWGLIRHPAQLYEAILYLIIFLILWRGYKKNKIKYQGYLFGVFLAMVFSIRFIVEFIKENQVGFEDNLFLNMGQILSFPLILVGIYFIFKSQKVIDSKS